MFSELPTKETGKSKVFTDDNSFYYFTPDQTNLYVKKTYPTEQAQVLKKMINDGIIIPQNSEDKKYNKYRFSHLLFSSGIPDNEDNQNDCLNMAETLSLELNDLDKVPNIGLENMRNTKYPLQTSILQDKYSKQRFGDDDVNNKKIAQITPDKMSNNNAIPNAGETYAMVVMDKKLDGRFPYHIAFVIHSHKDVNITLEASAYEPNAKDEYIYPKFNFYSRNPNDEFNFYNKTVEDGYKNSKLIVLEPRNKEEIKIALQNELNGKLEETTPTTDIIPTPERRSKRIREEEPDIVDANDITETNVPQNKISRYGGKTIKKHRLQKTHQIQTKSKKSHTLRTNKKYRDKKQSRK
jgi:hypothetical protein